MAKDCYYFKHDSNARNDAKIICLRNKYGNVAYGNYWIIIEQMRESSNYKLQDKDYVWTALSQEMFMPVEEVKAFVKDCIESFELFVQEDGFFYSPSFLKRMADMDFNRQKKVYAGEKSGEIRRKKKEDTWED
jgi:hypothetical protein